MAWIDDTLMALVKQSFPKSRAFKIPADGVFEKLIRASNASLAKEHNAAVGILDSIIPDSDNFSADDATQWERRLAIINGGSSVPLAQRKAAILQKMAYPGTSAPRCAASYLEAQLQLAGFDVYVYENIFSDGSGGWITKTPDDILGTVSGAANLGNFNLGGANLGAIYGGNVTIAVNYLEEEKDNEFVIAPNYRSTFFIAGSTITTFADVLAARKNEFRQLIISLKPTQTVAFLFVTYT